MNARGFTLVELIVGMVVFAIALTIVTSILAPQARRGIDPIYQVRATELAQSIFNEMSAKAFDENSVNNGTGYRCGQDLNNDGLIDDTAGSSADDGEAQCTAAASLGPEESDRENYDDIDDYHCADANPANCSIENSLGASITVNGTDIYAGFFAQVRVFYDSDYDGNEADNEGVGLVKHVRIIVTTPNDESLSFSTFRTNF